MKMEQTECSETLAFKLQTPGNNPEESIRHLKHGEILKSRRKIYSQKAWPKNRNPESPSKSMKSFSCVCQKDGEEERCVWGFGGET
jgi:hypothetical protein